MKMTSLADSRGRGPPEFCFFFDERKATIAQTKSVTPTSAPTPTAIASAGTSFVSSITVPKSDSLPWVERATGSSLEG